MRWDRVVYQGLHAIMLQMFTQPVTSGSEYRKNMEYMRICLGCHLWQNHFRILYFLHVSASHPATAFVIFVQPPELHIQNRCLQLVQTAVYTLLPMDIFLRGAIIGYGTHCSGKPCIVSGYSAAIP